MNQLAVIDNDLAARRSAAARKAVETRRRNLALNPQSPANLFKVPARRGIDAALAAFDVEANAEMPDWYKVALALKSALTSASENRSPRPQTIRQPQPWALPAPPWHDYDVKAVGAFHVVSPTIVVTFADGEVVRAPAVDRRGKPVNIGRGLRVACAFYQARMTWREGKSVFLSSYCAVPEITACHCEDTGEVYDAALCSAKTIENRKAVPR